MCLFLWASTLISTGDQRDLRHRNSVRKMPNFYRSFLCLPQTQGAVCNLLKALTSISVCTEPMICATFPRFLVSDGNNTWHWCITRLASTSGCFKQYHSISCNLPFLNCHRTEQPSLKKKASYRSTLWDTNTYHTRSTQWCRKVTSIIS